MKATGIVRRIDDLGRVVIPKETRKIFGIREGDPLEICVSDGMINLIPYHPEHEYASRLKDLRTDITEDTDMCEGAKKTILSGIDDAIARLEAES